MEQYRALAGEKAVQVVEVSEQEIMDAMLTANRNGHIACTQGGECLAGIREGSSEGEPDNRVAVLDATAHCSQICRLSGKVFHRQFRAGV